MTLRLALALLLVVTTAAGCRPPAPATGPDLFLASRRAMRATDSIRTIAIEAEVASPSGGFEVRIASATDGRVRMALGPSLRAGVVAGAGWLCDPTGVRLPLDSVTLSFVRGHDLHMLLLAPTWLSGPTREPDRRWGADSVMTLRYQDELGAPLLLHLRAVDTLPLGLEVVNHTGTGPREVRVRFDNWQDHAGVRLFRTATFEHGDNRFVYTFTSLGINTASDTTFAPRCAAESPREAIGG